jgi:hypothetical protein
MRAGYCPQVEEVFDAALDRIESHKSFKIFASTVSLG